MKKLIFCLILSLSAPVIFGNPRPLNNAVEQYLKIFIPVVPAEVDTRASIEIKQLRLELDTAGRQGVMLVVVWAQTRRSDPKSNLVEKNRLLSLEYLSNLEKSLSRIEQILKRTDLPLPVATLEKEAAKLREVMRAYEKLLSKEEFPAPVEP